MRYHLAIDIGASSGRHIVGWQSHGEIETKEVYRFANGVQSENGHLIWDIDRLEQEVRAGIDKALEEFPTLESLSIDTWGVDYVLMQGDAPLLPCYAYRDSRTETAIEQVHKLIPFEELYAHTGIQFESFNTIYQLYADKLAGRLDHVTDYLMMPQYLMWKLCGVKSHEYTLESTGGLLNAATKQFDSEIIERLGLPTHLFGEISQPGVVLGEYKGVKVMLCPTHDTASAVEGIPMQKDGLFLSSGTWSLLGAKLPSPITTAESCKANFSNEGGVGYVRYLKNIMGMWMVNNLRDELCPETSFGEIVTMAEQSNYSGLVNVTDHAFLAPESMSEAMRAALAEQNEPAPATPADFFRCAYCSLAVGYGKAVRELEKLTGKTYDTLYIVGGGAKNQFLNKLTEQETKKTVIALPIEATALGNLRSQINCE